MAGRQAGHPPPLSAIRSPSISGVQDVRGLRATVTLQAIRLERRVIGLASQAHALRSARRSACLLPACLSVSSSILPRTLAVSPYAWPGLPNRMCARLNTPHLPRSACTQYPSYNPVQTQTEVQPCAQAMSISIQRYRLHDSPKIVC